MLVKLKYLLTEVGRGFQASQNLLVEKDSLSKDRSYLSWFNIRDLTNSYLFESQKYLLKDNISFTKIYPPNSLLIGLDGSIGKLGISTTSFVMNSHCCVLSCNDSLEMKYLYYYLLLLYDFDYFSKISHGSLFQTITIDVLKSLPIPFFPLSHQGQIVTFLNLKLDLIQQLFSKIDLLLKKLEEYQASLINEQVIQNNSSINYIKFKYLFQERNELTLDTFTYPCFSVSRTIGIIPLGKNITKTRIPLKRKIIYPNDLVLKARSWGDHHYASALSSVTGSLSSVYFVFYSISNIINLKYMDYLFQSVFFKYQFLLLGKGIGDLTWSTHYNQLKELKWKFPSLSNQNEIVSFLTPKLEALSKLKQYYYSLKKHLEEYQQSLLYETFQNLS